MHNIPEGLAVGIAFGAVAAGFPAATLPAAVALIEFILEGLYAGKKLSRSEERGYFKEAVQSEEEFLGDPALSKRSFN